LTGPAVQVFIDANGQLGTLTQPIANGTGTVTPLGSQPQIEQQEAMTAALQRQVEDQHKAMADLRGRLAGLEALMAKATSAK
jgi:hypothetical protein